MVAVKASASRNVPGKVYELVRLLPPHNGREFEYLIKSRMSYICESRNKAN
jgi:hypothetical protein